RYLRINRLLAEINGVPEAEHIGKTIGEIVPALEEQAQQVVRTIITTGKPVTEIEFTGQTAAQPGVQRVWQQGWYPLKSDDNKVIGFMVIVQDITERRQAEHRVSERMKELQGLYGLAELAEREGITLDELHQEFANILPKSWQYPEIACARIVIGDSEFHTENFAESPWKQSATVRVHRSVVGRVEVGYLQEKPEEDEGPFLKEERLLIDAIAERLGKITERTQAEENLARLSQKNELILRSAAEGILGLDLQGYHTFVNPAAARMLGYEAEELIGRLGHSTWHHTKADGSPYPREECAIYAAYRDGVVHRSSIEVFWRKDGTSFPVEYASRPIYEQGHHRAKATAAKARGNGDP
ncbi:MAG: PAS domain S-box protein, partial [Coprothermobacterota bacterium]|nr:PAS domain S-box protein [Coprothermobacterota bacterium]